MLEEQRRVPQLPSASAVRISASQAIAFPAVINRNVAVPADIRVVTPAPRLGRSLTVLHIEDDPSVARSVARALRLGGHEVVSVATRGEVLRQLEVCGLRPDLILTDYQLGVGLTGDMLVAEIAALLQFKPPTIMLTGVSERQAPNGVSFADRILAKPVDINALLREIDDLVSKQ
jgi:CheY-like chemotaxis protein